MSERAFRLGDGVEDAPGVLEEHLAGGGEAHAASPRTALDEPLADPLLEERDVRGDRRGREPHALRGRAERELFCEHAKRVEMAQLDVEPRRGHPSYSRGARERFRAIRPG